MKCSYCGNENESSLRDEGDTISCSCCTHRTRKAAEKENLIECPHCHKMRDGKAYYCRYCNMPFKIN